MANVNRKAYIFQDFLVSISRVYNGLKVNRVLQFSLTKLRRLALVYLYRLSMRQLISITAMIARSANLSSRFLSEFCHERPQITSTCPKLAETAVSSDTLRINNCECVARVLISIILAQFSECFCPNLGRTSQ